MNDAGWATLWMLAFGSGLGGAVVVRGLGVPTTYVRDLLHVGAGVWVLGWPSWGDSFLPVALVAVAVAVTIAVPWLAPRMAFARALKGSVSDAEERWTGLVGYTVSFFAFTLVGLAGDPAPAAAALLALSLGDGIGGAVGRRFGAHFYRVPGGKPKSLEGSAAVALASMLGAVIAGAWFDAPFAWSSVLLVGCVAAVAEAMSPAATDNLTVPAAVWLALQVTS